MQILSILGLVLAVTAAPQNEKHNLPVLFQFSQPSHSVSVFRGAALKNAIAAGLVKGFGNLGAGAGAGAGDSEDREGRSGDGGADGGSGSGAATYAPTAAPIILPSPPPPAPLVYKPAPAPLVYRPAPAPIVFHQPAPAPAPLVYRQPAPVPVVYRPAPAPVVYRPAPSAVYKSAPSYVEPVYAQDAQYNWEYAVLDDYSANNFGAKESRSGALTSGKYSVMLPDGRLQTVTWTVDGDLGYVPTVEYSGEAQYAA